MKIYIQHVIDILEMDHVKLKLLYVELYSSHFC